jgi:hypothetical protein
MGNMFMAQQISDWDPLDSRPDIMYWAIFCNHPGENMGFSKIFQIL